MPARLVRLTSLDQVVNWSGYLGQSLQEHSFNAPGENNWENANLKSNKAGNNQQEAPASVS